MIGHYRSAENNMAFDISEQQVVMTEAEIGRKLPSTYRSMMMTNNGGTAFDDEDQWDIHPLGTRQTASD